MKGYPDNDDDGKQLLSEMKEARSLWKEEKQYIRESVL